MSSMKAYLAEKYMSGPKADAILSKVNPPKKKKRKINIGGCFPESVKPFDFGSVSALSIRP